MMVWVDSPDVMTNNGHCCHLSLSGNNCIFNDSYPDENRLHDGSERQMCLLDISGIVGGKKLY